MKYDENNQPLVCMLTNSTCYKSTTRLPKVKGVLWHCTGANNPWLKRYVQPSREDKNYDKLMKLLGQNQYGNDWNHVNVQAGVHAWIGKLADGAVTTVQTLPYDLRCWGCGSGRVGSCNNGWIQFEICEDALTDITYFKQAYQEACEYTAYLCKKFNIDPNGTVDYNGIKVPTILCHYDAYLLKVGSNHGDIYNWFPKFGINMDNVRHDVTEILEEEDMTVDKFAELWREYRKGLQDNDAASYSATAREWAINNKIIAGGSPLPNGQPNYMWEDTLTREQMVTLLYRFAQYMGKIK